MLKSVGFKLSPFFTPKFAENGSLCEFPNLQEYIVFEDIFVIKSKNFPPILFFNNL